MQATKKQSALTKITSIKTNCSSYLLQFYFMRITDFTKFAGESGI